VKEKEKSSGMGWFGVLLLAVPLLYVTLSGPAIGLARSGRLGFHEPRWLAGAFDPVVVLAGDTVFERPLERYIAWWAVLLEPKDPPVLLYR
jgi:hypothetical protein